ncbi:MAG: extracellular solute-binding protein [Chloroflexota bacterium]
MFNRLTSVRISLWASTLFVLVFVSACQPFPSGALETQQPNPTSPGVQSPSPLKQATSSPPSTPGFTLWLPPQWDPAMNTPAAQLFQQRLQTFQTQFPNLPLEIRIKAVEGAGGMQEALLSASAAAPMALPDLVAMPRPLLDSVSQKGILHPLDSYSQSSNENDSYAYARQLALVQNTPYGIPFAGDFLLLAYPASISGEMPTNWSAWLESPLTLGFNAADNQAAVLLSLYLSAGGKIQDDQGKPTLEAPILTQILEDLAFASRQGKLPPWVTQTDSTQAVLQALSERRVDSAYLWSSVLLSGNYQDWAIAPGFSIAGKTTTLANGWIWASPSPRAEMISISFQLAAFLSEDAFLAQWSEAAGVVPTKPAALSLWKDTEFAASLNIVSESAQLAPPQPIVSVIAPALRNAALAVLKDRVPADQAASDAVASLVRP